MEHFDRNTYRFPVSDTGPGDGEVVVLLHGFPQDTSCYDQILPHLHGAGLRTLVPLQRGYSATARPRRRRDYRLSELVEDILALIEAAGLDRVHLVGHDWGAVVGWAMAERYPDRLRTLTALSVPHPAAFAAALVRSSQAWMSAYMAFFQLPAVPEAMLRRTLRATLRRSGLPAETAGRYSQSMQGSALTGALNWYRAMPFSFRSGLRSVRVPSTYVWGRKDFALGRVAAERTARHVLSDYRFVDLDAGHWLPETRPVEVAAAILARARPR